MKNKEDIENYEEKSKFLNDNGWVSLWHPDNWIKEEWYNDPSINVDRAGISMDQAYNNCKEIRKLLNLD